MTADEAKKLVVEAGRRLVEAGLVARTWGNVSCRIDAERFAVTPSGREYASLAPDDIVEVRISDCSWSGTVKPSSEKGIHAEVYRHHPDMNFVIHTHQENASIVSALGSDGMPVEGNAAVLGEKVICARYALPGTKTLRRNVAAALGRGGGRAVIMKHHGALCFGKGPEEVFETALALEAECGYFLRNRRERETGFTTGSSPRTNGRIPDAGLQASGNGPKDPGDANGTMRRTPETSGYDSERTRNGFVLYDRRTGRTTEITSEPRDGDASDGFPLETVNLHADIYRNLKTVKAVVQSRAPNVLAVSSVGIRVRPLLDDFAQIAGTSVRTVGMDGRGAVAALRSASAVLLEGDGALCCGATRGDAEAVAVIMEKNCAALAGATPSGRVRYLGRIDCLLMRIVYTMKYSKLAGRE